MKRIKALSCNNGSKPREKELLQRYFLLEGGGIGVFDVAQISILSSMQKRVHGIDEQLGYTQNSLSWGPDLASSVVVRMNFCYSGPNGCQTDGVVDRCW